MKHLLKECCFVLAVAVLWTSGAVQAQLYNNNNYGYGNYGPYVTRPFAYTPFAGSGLYRPQPSLYAPSTYSYYYYQPATGLYANQPYRAIPSNSYYGRVGVPYNSYYYIPNTGVPSNPAAQNAYEQNQINPNQSVTAAPAKQSSEIVVKLPNADAVLWFGSNKTKQNGLERDFVTPELEPGKTFKYQITAQWMEQGIEVQKTRNIQFVAGQKLVVDFTNSGK